MSTAPIEVEIEIGGKEILRKLAEVILSFHEGSKPKIYVGHYTFGKLREELGDMELRDILGMPIKDPELEEIRELLRKAQKHRVSLGLPSPELKVVLGYEMLVSDTLPDGICPRCEHWPAGRKTEDGEPICWTCARIHEVQFISNHSDNRRHHEQEPDNRS